MLLLIQVQDREESLVLPETAILNIEHCAAYGQLFAVMLIKHTWIFYSFFSDFFCMLQLSQQYYSSQVI